MSVKHDLTRLRQDADALQLSLMRRGDMAAVHRLLAREHKALVNDLYSVPDLYAAEVERVIASAPDSVAAQYRAAWALIPAIIEADRIGDEARGLELAAQITSTFDALPKWNGERLWNMLDDFYRATRPGFKLADEDLLKIGELLLQERDSK